MKIAGVVPEPDGSVSITIYGTLQGGFGYMNVFSIEGAPSVGGYTTRGNVPASSNNTTVVVKPERSGIEGNVGEVIANNLKGIKETGAEMMPEAEVYPNPFRDDVTLKFDLKENIDKFTVFVTDLSGTIVHRLEVENALKGIWLQRLGLSGKFLPSGIYTIRIIGLPGYEQRMLKIIKQE